MVINDIQKSLNTSENIRVQLVSSLRRIEAIAESQNVMQNMSLETMYKALGPIRDLQDAYGNVVLQSLEGLRPMYDLIEKVEKRFVLPEGDTATKLLRQFEGSAARKLTEEYNLTISELQRSLEAMTKSWFDVDYKLGSVYGFVALQGIGHAINTTQSFDVHLTESLRVDLGDWRKGTAWPHDIVVDPIARTSFYVERGLNPKLTMFPSDAFQEITTSNGLRDVEPILVEEYDFGLGQEGSEEEIAFKRTNEAHDLIQRFETQLRKFINERMRGAFGGNWVRHQVPGDMRKRWIDKRQKANDSGEQAWPLIAYADFADYAIIITKSDTWKVVFEEVFLHKVSVQESFRRLYPIRICTMHSRVITQDDELYLLVETKRILSAMEMDS